MTPIRTLTRRQALILVGAVTGATSLGIPPARAVSSVEIAPQPYFAGVSRALEALAKLGSPVAAADAQQLATLAVKSDRASVEVAEQILSRYTLATLAVGSDGAAHVAAGAAPRQLIEQGWRMFLIRIENPAAENGSVVIGSGIGGAGQMAPGLGHMAQRAYLIDRLFKGPLIEKMWFKAELYDATPLVHWGMEVPTISLAGIPVEYRVLQIFSRDAGERTTDFTLYLLAKPDGAFRSGHQQLDFNCLPSREVRLRVTDSDGRGCMASLTIRDKLNHLYPPQAMRIAPDLFFHEQIYRADGESVRLPNGEYTVDSKRGPEYLRGTQIVTVDGEHSHIEVTLQRWIDPAKWGWYSGDTHIHAAGCAHYQVPTEGVSPETMIRHMRGEALTIGDSLNWSPSWYYQRQFFSGHAESPAATLEHPELQKANNVQLQPQATPEDAESILRYDVEVSGFPSSHAGHLVLLRLKEQDYPGAQLIEEWPTWNLPILQWARSQGALAGYAHCGNGMVVDSTELPNYEIPPMDDNGTQEGIIDVTHGLVDFLSGCDTPPVAELNAWYHMLNCGFRMAMIGETDFPCLSGERVGTGRSYVQLDTRPVGDAGYEAWVRGLQRHRQYCGDGRSHILHCKINRKDLQEADVVVKAGASVTVEALVAAWLEPQPTPDLPARLANDRGYDIEKARIAGTREVPVELVVNGLPVDTIRLVADGVPRTLKLKANIARSSWLAIRILPSVHAHPVFVQVAGKPIRASRRSAQWCRACVDKVWEVKSPFMRESERPAAAEAFDHARKAYDTIAGECEVA
jgi:hypothetical protein